jgi:hypothetical protein
MVRGWEGLRGASWFSSIDGGPGVKLDARPEFAGGRLLRRGGFGRAGLSIESWPFHPSPQNSRRADGQAARSSGRFRRNYSRAIRRAATVANRVDRRSQDEVLWRSPE